MPKTRRAKTERAWIKVKWRNEKWTSTDARAFALHYTHHHTRIELLLYDYNATWFNSAFKQDIKRSWTWLYEFQAWCLKKYIPTQDLIDSRREIAKIIIIVLVFTHCFWLYTRIFCTRFCDSVGERKMHTKQCNDSLQCAKQEKCS